MWKNWKRPASNDFGSPELDYNQYSFSLSEWILYLLEGGILVWMIGYCFYDSLFATILLSPVLLIFLKMKRQELETKQRDNLRLQFKDAVLAVSGNQKAGYSIENAFREAYNDMRMLHGKKSLICKELEQIVRGLDNNIVLEKMLLSLGERSGVDDIREFGEVFSIAKRSGGNVNSVIALTASVIDEKVDVEQEIKVMISAKKMESDVMSLIPFIIIFYMDATSDGFFEVLYHNPLGIGIMTISLLVYGAAFMLAKKIVNIQI